MIKRRQNILGIKWREAEGGGDVHRCYQVCWSKRSEAKTFTAVEERLANRV